jgi:hypothetical protein
MRRVFWVAVVVGAAIVGVILWLRVVESVTP